MSLKIIYTATLFPTAQDFAVLSHDQGVVICPNPAMADGVRRLLDQQLNLAVDVLTISKATAELKERLELTGNSLRKADILMHFATLWKSVYGAKAFEMFIQSYQLFSEFRSFTTNFDLVTEALGALSQEQQKALTLYWRYLEQSEILDEHALYEQIAAACLEIEDPADSPLWPSLTFWGFPHLSGTQISLIKSVANIARVNVFFPAPLIPFVHSYDYIAWLDPQVEAQKKLVVAPPEHKPRSLPVVRFAKKRLGGVLKDHFSSEDFVGREILLCAKRSDYNLYQEIPFAPLIFKTPNDGLQSLANGLIKELRFERVAGRTSSIDYLDFIDEQLKTSFEEQDFRQMRVLIQYKKLLSSYSELSSLNEELDSFDLKLFDEIFNATLPRMFTSSLNPDQAKSIQLSALDSLASEKKDRVSLMIVSSHYGPLKLKESYYPEEVAEFLAVVGPVKRSDFDFQMLKLRLQSLLNENELTLVIEGHLEAEDPAWNDILTSYELVEQSTQKRPVVAALNDFQVTASESYQRMMSASSLQLYRDCPRKFYVSKIAKLDTLKSLSVEVAPHELGSLEHALIGHLYPKARSLPEIRREIHAAFDDFIKNEKKKISPLRLKGHLFEIEEAVFNGLSFLDSLCNELKVNKVEFDVKLSGKSGEADCIVKWNSDSGPRWGLIDFKRSKSSIGTKSEVQDFRKIQLPFYLNNLALSSDQCSFIAYVNLSALEDSTLIRLEHSFDTELKFVTLDMSASEFINSSRSFLEDLEQRLRSDTSYLAEPINAQTCTYCPIRNVCLKSTAEVEDAHA